jgi:hypothetical protein
LDRHAEDDNTPCTLLDAGCRMLTEALRRRKKNEQETMRRISSLVMMLSIDD